MGTQTVQLDVPDELMAILGSTDAAAAKARNALILEFLREARISQGLAARLLGITRWELLDLMAERQIPSGPATAEEMHQEIEDLRRFVDEHRPNAGRQ
jgi:predicted HTH domain antitoxin